MTVLDMQASFGSSGQTPVEAVVSRVEEVTGRRATRAGVEFKLLCPAHEDRNPSLNVRAGSEDRALVLCRAGCQTDAILHAIGMDFAELFVPAVSRPTREVVRVTPDVTTTTEHVYVDADGCPLYRVVITRRVAGGKAVKQHAALPNGLWAKTLGKAQLVPYRLPNVLRAIRTTAMVFIVEGEKCVEAVESLGLVATTNSGGAGKWRPEFGELFAGATVVVIPDNDGPGLEHASQVVDSVAPYAHEVVQLALPDLPEKGDIADWVAAGGTRDELLALVRQRQVDGDPSALNAGNVSTPKTPTWPKPVLQAEALHGLFGEALELVADSTEAEPAAILLHLLVGFGAMVGPRPYVQVGTARQRAKTFGVVVGDSAKARKGTAWGDAKLLFSAVDQLFLDQHYTSGLSTGEGLIARVRDPSNDVSGSVNLSDNAPVPPPVDPRLLIVEPEWGKVLRQNQRQGSTLSAVIREAWDNNVLEVMTRADPLRSTYHHIALLGHVTVEEVLAELDSTQAANGFANRHLWCFVERTKILPRPKPVSETKLARIASLLRGALSDGAQVNEVTPTAEAWELWETIYPDMETGPMLPGIAGHLTSRGPAQTMRLALIYALADRRSEIDVEHLSAAYAMWQYSEASVRHVFGQRLGNPLAERLLQAARAAGPAGIGGREQHAALDRNLSKEDLERAVDVLVRLGLAKHLMVPAGVRGGRPRTVLVAV